MESDKKSKRFFNRYTALVVVSMLIFSALLIKLIFMQIIDTQSYKDQSNTDSVKEISEPGPRGDIVDRNGVVLATDKQSYVLTFMSTEQSNLAFFDTMEKVFKILDDKKETQSDSFPLKLNPYRFDFNTSDTKAQQTLELRFKKDRGLDDDIINKKAKTNSSYKDKSYNDLSLSEQVEVDQELLKITPEETYKWLWEQYTKSYLDIKNKTISQAVKDKINHYTLDEQRRFMLVKDALKMQSFSGYKPVAIAQNINRDTAFVFEEQFSELPGIDISQQPIRTYPFGELASGVIGNISRITSDKQEQYLELGYDVNTDLVGVSGIEGTFESRLRGTKGSTKVEVSKTGRIVKEKAKMEPYPGEKLQLAINSDIQAIAEKALDKAMKELQQNPNKNEDVNTGNATRGAVVVLNANTGEVLALVSRPGYDPNMFAETGGLTSDQSKKYFAPDFETIGNDFIDKMGLTNLNPDMTKQQLLDFLFPVDKSIKSAIPTRTDAKDIYARPFFNYALNGAVQPGSTFKPVTAIAGLETGVITPNDTVDDQRFFTGDDGKPVWFLNDPINGIVNMKDALAKSSNPYFMELGRKLRNANLATPKEDILAQFAWKLGLGAPQSVKNPGTGIEIKSESFGQVYNSNTLKNNYANIYWIKIADALNTGRGYRNNTFPVIHFETNANDSVSVKKIKSDIKALVQDLIKNGKSQDTSLLDLLKKLVSSDERYKDQKFEKGDYASIITEINHLAIYTANNEINGGFNMYDASIGQSINAFTPLQMADYVATLVNGGNRYKIHLVDKITDADGTVLQETKPQILSTTGFKQQNVDAVKAGMKGVTGEGGTAAESFKNFPIETGGKTGTATYNNDQRKWGRSPYAWFVGFAPFDKPEISVSAVVYDGGYGSSAAPVVRDVYEAYFKDSLKSNGFVPEDDFVQEFYNK
jgi:penicillin-binding protein 2